MEENREDLRLYSPCLTLEVCGANTLGERYLLRAPLGLRPDSYDHARRFLVHLVSHFVMQHGCAHESYVALHQTRTRETIELFTDHARDWLPETVLGVWTHLPAPRMMTAEDLMEMDPKSPSGTRAFTLFRVTTGSHACMDAMTTMAGTGTSIQIVSSIEAEKLLRNWKDIFLKFIKERLYRIFPWYVPLLTMKTLEEDPTTALSEEALSGISLYIRESPEDGGFLILSRGPLEDVLLQTGCQRIDRIQGAQQWKLPE